VNIFLVGYAYCSDLPLSRVSLYDKLVHTCVPASVNDRKLYCTWVCLSCGMIKFSVLKPHLFVSLFGLMDFIVAKLQNLQLRWLSAFGNGLCGHATF